MKLKDLKANKRNPRKISGEKLMALKRSLEKFGDLSGFVYNRRTKQLVSGHQRTRSLPEDATIKIEVKHDQPTGAFTVAEGYVLIGNERFKYREVDAPEEWEYEALLAANKHGGEWDYDILKLGLADFPSIDLDMAGFSVPELQSLNIDFNPTKIAAPVIVAASSESKDEETDEQYIKNNPGPESYENKERLPDLINRTSPPPADPAPVRDIDPASDNPFDKVDETTEPAGRRVIIIIDCDGDDELKKEMKEKLRPVLEGTKAKFF